MPVTPSPDRTLDQFLDKFTPEIAALGRGMLAKVRARLTGATELVYDNTYALVVGFSPNDRPSDAVLSVVLYPRYANLYFLNGAVLADPAGLLQGSGKVGRHIKVERAEALDEPAVRELIDDAIALNEVPFDPARPRKIEIRLEAPKQRSRRPPPPKAKRAARY